MDSRPYINHRLHCRLRFRNDISHRGLSHHTNCFEYKRNQSFSIMSDLTSLPFSDYEWLVYTGITRIVFDLIFVFFVVQQRGSRPVFVYFESSCLCASSIFRMTRLVIFFWMAARRCPELRPVVLPGC
jgi:hypothetical protein